MEMEASSPPASSLRHVLRATVCCCFGGDRAQWGRRRAGGSSGGEFRYDPLSYALNFDDQGPNGDGDEYESSIEDFGDGDGGLLIYRGFSSSSQPPRSTTGARAGAVAAA